MDKQSARPLKIAGGRSDWDAAWRSVKLGDTVLAAQPGFSPVKFEVIVRAGGDGFAPLQIAGENTLLYGEPWPLQILPSGASARSKQKA